MLLTQQFLRDHPLAELSEKYAVSVRRHGKYPNLAMLKYSQINSPMAEPIVQECRGLILDEADNWRVVSFPFTKFFNHGEGHAAPIDWASAAVYDKLDGSLMTLYWYDRQWHVASSGMPDAAGGVNTAAMTFAELFWATWKSAGYQLPAAETGAIRCYMFELMTPHNRVVVPYNIPRLVLIGARSLEPGAMHEIAPETIAPGFGWEHVQSYPLNSFDACMAAVQAIDPMQGEGYVVRDGSFNRVKVKSPAYVAIAHLKEGMSGGRLLEIVRLNESSEFLSYFPEWTHAYGEVRAAFDALCAALEADYARLKDIPVQKEFAMEALKTRCSGALFAIRKGTYKSVREYFANCPLSTLEQCIGLDLTKLLPTQETQMG